MEKIFKFLVAFVSSIFLCVGCSVKVHKDYSFTEPETGFSAGSIHAKLRGTMRNIDDYHSSTGTPYELLIWFSVKNFTEAISCKVILKKITLKNVESHNIIPINPTADTKFKLKSDGRYIANVMIKNLDLEYEMHELSFIYSFVGNCFDGEPATKAKLEFRKNFQERNISFWDSLMGV